MRMRVYYILSSSHSGSTLLNLLLDSHSNIAGLGSLRRFESFFTPEALESGKHYNDYCTCGKKVYDCPFWDRMNERNPLSTMSINKKPAENRLFLDEAAKISGKHIICDSSKGPERLALYLKQGFDVCIIHLVRDGRAYAYSHVKKDRDFYVSLKEWMLNKELHNTYSRYSKYYLLRYEDLIMAPINTLSTLLQIFDEEYEPQQLRYIEHTHHGIGGNRMRMSNAGGIRFDDSFLRSLTNKQWYEGTKLAKDCLTFFGYPIQRSNYLSACAQYTPAHLKSDKDRIE